MWLTVALVACVVFCLWLRSRRPANFPPGPPCLPVIGTLPFLPRKHLHLAMMAWHEKYGPVVGVMMGAQPLVAVCGPDEIKELLRRDEFQGRPDNFFVRERSFGKRLGVIFADGPLWVEQRRFTLRHLRDLGFAKYYMATVMHEEFEELAKEMKQQGTIEVSGLFPLPVVNVLWAVVAGNRFSHDDKRLHEVMDHLQRAFRASGIMNNMIAALPLLRYVAPKNSGYSITMRSVTEIQQLLKEIIQDHKKKLDVDNPRDLIDIYLREIHLQSGDDNTTFTEENLIMLCLDLFVAGSDTVSNTLGFCLLYMVLYPEVQKTAQQELDSVVGDRRPVLEDRNRLPYVEAVLSEVSRINSVAPMTVPHRCMEDTYAYGYFIPKDAMVIFNLHGIHNDRRHWGDPDVFRPGRFLDSAGQYVKDEWLTIFGLGKRSCLGESLARNSLFVFFACLLQEFTFCLPDDGGPPPTTVPQTGMTSAPQPFKVKVTRRV